MSARVESAAGITPVSSAVSRVTTSASISARLSMPIISRWGIPAGASARTTRTALNASATPSSPPVSASSVDSVISWRMSRDLPAPSAARIASSCVRADPRSNCRFATLMHAIRSNSAAATAATSRIGRTSPTIRSRNVMTTGCMFRSGSEGSVLPARITRAISAEPSSMDCPERSRPTRSNTMAADRSEETSTVAGNDGNTGNQACTPRGNSRPRGMTPTMVNRLSFQLNA